MEDKWWEEIPEQINSKGYEGSKVFYSPVANRRRRCLSRDEYFAYRLDLGFRDMPHVFNY